jgi:hypothetical protein
MQSKRMNADFTGSLLVHAQPTMQEYPPSNESLSPAHVDEAEYKLNEDKETFHASVLQ